MDASTPQINRPAGSATGSRRRRLWELGSHAHCPVIGVCLPTPALRQVIDKALGGQAQANDYELHCGAVQDSHSRTRTAEAIQRALEARHAGPVRLAAACKSTEALAQWWQMQSGGTGLPGALWALLTHPRCDIHLEERVLADVHMRQHQVGHADRADQARVAALEADNAQLSQALAASRARAAQQAELHARERDRLQAEHVRLRGQLLARDAQLLQLQDSHEDLRRAAPDLPARLALSAQLSSQIERTQSLQRALNQSQDLLQRLQAATPAVAAGDAELVSANTDSAAPAMAAPRAVLCVGGRSSAVPLYRRVVEDIGARFDHHDGGQEDKVQRLHACLAAADLVICQVGCVSHDAYWRVKDHCKRTGKRCVFVDNPSATCLKRALDHLNPAHTAKEFL